MKALKDRHFQANNAHKIIIGQNIDRNKHMIEESGRLMDNLRLYQSNKRNEKMLRRLFAGIKQISDDGWCFYHSIITALENNTNKDKAIALSHQVVQWLHNNRATAVTNNNNIVVNNNVRTIEQIYNTILLNSIIPIHDNKYGQSRTLTFNEYLDLSNRETDEQLPVVWPELAIVGYAIANLKNIELNIYSYQTAERTMTFKPFNMVPRQTVSLWHSNNNHFDLLVPRL